ncbi:unnamed protein product [Cylindrotheca closterium]|uniref:Glycosyl transferase family 1 domain-containing protein n=1 Tax=Cylindrotheca closterium TaxID=2856 RepID=A0AAD2CG92_9STRA|nr:unnamed protein product [Cylindrotheca closterium]
MHRFNVLLTRLILLFSAVVLIHSSSGGSNHNDNEDDGHMVLTDQVWTVSWNAPFLSSSSGYGSEATSFLIGLNQTLPELKEKGDHWQIGAGLAHADSIDHKYMNGLPTDLEDLFFKASGLQHIMDPDFTVVVCHSEPGAWSVPTPLYESPWPCPPPIQDNNKKKWKKLVGRTMFETDRLPNGWDDRLNQMDEIWVPTHHHKQIFENGGVTKPVVVVGQGIDVDYWDPHEQEPLPFDKIDKHSRCSESDYKFLSVFKWESRKGPDILLPSFFNAFPGRKGACLIIVTSLYHRDAELVVDEVKAYWKQHLQATTSSTPNQQAARPEVKGVILLTGLKLKALVRLYNSVDAFVLPSRGEGWGRPYMEAMAMGLPVIATNWSGPTEFLNEDNGYLLPIRGLVNANLDSFPGHKWADPDPAILTKLMKHLSENPNEGKVKGQRARKDAVEKWSNLALSRDVARELQRLAGRSSDNVGGGSTSTTNEKVVNPQSNDADEL